MHLLLRTGLTGLVLAGLATTAVAQCPAGASFNKYGATCTFFGQAGVLDGKYDPASCTLRLQFSASTTCCNTFPAAQALLIGAQPVTPGVPHPALVRGCELAVLPLVTVVVAGHSQPFDLRVPAIGTATIYAQGVTDYFTTIGFSHDYQTTQGLQIDFR